MRKNILSAGFALLAVALLFGLSYPAGMLFSIPLSILNIILGLITRTPLGLDDEAETSDVRLIIDRGVVGASIYRLVFLSSKLILKRLNSVLVTVVLPLILAIVGLEVLFIIGALTGGITGFSLQEYLTQRARDTIGTGIELTQAGKHDIEISFDDLHEVRLVRGRLHITTENSTFVAGLPRSYSSSVSPFLEKILGSRFVSEESVRSVKASQK